MWRECAMMALMTVHDVDAAQVRCARLAAGVRENELEDLLEVDAGTVAAWEELRGPIAEDAAQRLAEMTVAAAAEAVRLIEQASAGEQIVTFGHDADVLAATGGRLGLASVHRVCAGRAALAVPGAEVVIRDSDGDRDGRMLCVTAACGMGLGQVQKWFDVKRRMAQNWLGGLRPVPPGVIEELRQITAEVGEHIDELAATIDADSDDPVLWVCATDEQMEDQWPERAQLPLSTHQVCAARAAAAVDGARLVFLPR